MKNNQKVIIDIDELLELKKRISNIDNSVFNIKSRLSSSVNIASSISSSFSNKLNEAIKSSSNVSKLIEEMNYNNQFAINLYNSIFEDNTKDVNILNKKVELFNAILIGQFAANQSGPFDLLKKGDENYDSLTDIQKQQYDKLKELLIKYGYITKEGYWNSPMNAFVENSRNVGCGFAANTNILIDYYSKIDNGEELFLEKYGFPLYYVDDNNQKNYNYDLLFTTHYLNSIEKFSQQVIPGVDLSIPDFWPKWNPSFLNSIFNSSGGTKDFQRMNALKNELDDREISQKKYSGTNLEQYSNEFYEYDYAAIAAQNFTLKDLNGEYAGSVNGGHFMLITGITNDGKYIVASWGKQYILENYDLADICFMDIE